MTEAAPPLKRLRRDLGSETVTASHVAHEGHHHERVGAGTALHHERRTWAVAAVSGAATAVLFAGGVLAGSTAVLGEALHLLAHVGAFVLAGAGYVAGRRLAAAGQARLARLVPDIAGSINGVILLALAIELALAGASRLSHPQAPDFPPALALAAFGLGANVIFALMLRHSSAHEHGHEADVNFRAVQLHVLSDAAVALLAILGLGAAWSLGWLWADAAAGVLGAAAVLLFGVRLLLACARNLGEDFLSGGGSLRR